MRHKNSYEKHFVTVLSSIVFKVVDCLIQQNGEKNLHPQREFWMSKKTWYHEIGENDCEQIQIFLLHRYTNMPNVIIQLEKSFKILNYRDKFIAYDCNPTPFSKKVFKNWE